MAREETGGGVVTFLTVTIRDADGAAVGVLVLRSKTFSTGSQGFHGQGKLELGGQRYQMQAQLVQLKPRADAPTPVEGMA